jgi:hypothetical protein
VQIVHQHQARDQIVGSEPLDQRWIGRGGDGHHPVHAGAVEVGQFTHQRLGALSRNRATGGSGVQQDLYPVAR